MEKKLKLTSLLKACLALIILTVLASQCVSNREDELKKKLISELLKHKKDDINFINLKTIFGDNWESICIVSSYNIKELLEKSIGKKLKDNFISPMEGGYVFIIFNTDGSQYYLHFNGFEVMYQQFDSKTLTSHSQLCTSTSEPFLYFEKNENGIKQFYLK